MCRPNPSCNSLVQRVLTVAISAGLSLKNFSTSNSVNQGGIVSMPKNPSRHPA